MFYNDNDCTGSIPLRIWADRDHLPPSPFQQLADTTRAMDLASSATMPDPRPTCRILDCGANEGRFADNVLLRPAPPFEHCEVHLYEPVPETVELARHRFRAHQGQMRVHARGCSDSPDAVRIAYAAPGDPKVPHGPHQPRPHVC
jgi:hypothetical protein